MASDSTQQEGIKAPAYRSFPEEVDIDAHEIDPDAIRKLESFITEDAADIFAAVARSENGPDEVELGPPTFTRDEDGWTFEPAGWVGKYPGDFEVNQQRVEDDDFDQMRRDVAGWIEIAGPATARSLLQFLPNIALSSVDIYQSYSQQLIEQTEAVLAHRPPVDIKFTRERKEAPRGRLLPRETLRERASGRQLTVSQTVSFTLDTLPNLLLLRFHLEMAGVLADLRESVPVMQDEFTGSISYHRDFVATQFPDGLVEQALQIDFDTPRCLARTRQEASSEMTRIIDLWEGFRNQTPLEIKISDGLDTAIKPAETIYELWVLGELLEALQTVTGSQPTFGEQGIDSPIEIGSFALRYDMPIDQDMSRLIAGAFDVQPAYRPDYVLKHIPSDRTIWVGDAKFRKELDYEDGYRFLRYVVDLLPAGASTPTVATVFAPDITERTETTDRGDYQIDIVQLSPVTPDTALSSIATLAQESR